MADCEEASRRLIAYLASSGAAAIPAATLDRARDLLIDHLAVSYAGLTLPWSDIVRRRALSEGGTPESTIYALGKVTARNAALANGTAAHALELDDTHVPSLSHMGAVVFPAALAVAESCDADGTAFLTAFVLGCEAMGRIGRAAGQLLVEAGFHPTSTNGVFGAAAAACRLLQCGEAVMADAFGLALSMASGVMQFSLETEGTMVKRLHAGLPAERGILAAMLAGEGFSGPARSIDGRFGFLAVFARGGDDSALAHGLGETFLVDEVSIKCNACCLHFAAVVDAIKACHAKTPLPGERIRRIVIFGPNALLDRHMEYRPRSVMAAQYSLPFTAAATIMLDAQDPDSFAAAAIGRGDVLDLADRVEAFVDERLDALFPAKFPARVRLIADDGTSVSHEVHDPLGSPLRPLHRADIVAKFHAVTGRVLSPVHRRALLDAVSGLEEPGGLRSFSAILQRPLGWGG